MKTFYQLTFTSGILLTVCLLSCDHEENEPIIYPETGFYGDNILFQEKTTYSKRENSLQCKLPSGKSITIKITGKTVVFSNGGLVPSIPSGIWYYDPGTINNWAVTNWDNTTYTQTFSSIDGGLTCAAKMMFDKGTFQIDYFENGSSSPSLTKTITVNY